MKDAEGEQVSTEYMGEASSQIESITHCLPSGWDEIERETRNSSSSLHEIQSSLKTWEERKSPAIFVPLNTTDLADYDE